MNTTTFARHLVCSLLLSAGLCTNLVVAQTPQPIDASAVPEAVRRAAEEQMRLKREAALGAGATAAEAQAKPIVRATPVITSTDPVIAKTIESLVGTFQAPIRADFPDQMHLGSAVITVEGLDNAVFFEVARAFHLYQPARQGIWHIWKRNDGKYFLRQFIFVNVPKTWANAVNGLWAAPELFPKVTLDMLMPVSDLEIKGDGGTFKIISDRRFPTTAGGAVEFQPGLVVTGTEIEVFDRGYDANGVRVWGPDEKGYGWNFVRMPNIVKVNRMETGIVTLDLAGIPDTTPTVAQSDSGITIAAHYTGWLLSGESFGTSRTANPTSGKEEPYVFQYPTTAAVPGLNMAVPGLGKGMIRKVYMPAELGYGARGRRNIPANSDLIFLFETLYTGRPETQPAAQPVAQPAVPAAAAPGSVPGAVPVAPVTPVAPGGSAVQPVSEDQVPAAVKKAFLEQQKKRAEEAAKKANQPAPAPTPPTSNP